jgi:hypothetical protein
LIYPFRPSHDKDEDKARLNVSWERYLPAVEWLTILNFLVLSSLLFAFLIEWDRYEVIIGPKAQLIPVWDQITLFWFLAAKSLFMFLPFLFMSALLIGRGYRRVVTVTVNIAWVTIFYFMLFDLVSVSFAGYHILDYVPNIKDMFWNPDMKVWQWAGEQLTSEALLVLLILIISGPVLFIGVRWTTKRLVPFCGCLCTRSGQWVATLCFIFITMGVLAPLGSLRSRVYAAMPLTGSFRGYLELGSDVVAGLFSIPEARPFDAGLLSLSSPLTTLDNHRRLALKNNSLDQEMDSSHSVTDDSLENRWGFTGISSLGKVRFATFPQQINSLTRFFNSRLGFSGNRSFLDTNRNLFNNRPASDYAGNSHTVVPDAVTNSQEQALATRLLHESLEPGSADPLAFVEKDQLPNVVMIIFESFRHNAVRPELMKDLYDWSSQGLSLQKHYSGSNCSHLGLFSLFYGRVPLGYHKTLDRKIPPQMLESLRRSGYEITFITSGEVKGFRRLDQFINNNTCDNFITDGEFSLKGMKDWPDSDRRKLSTVRRIVNAHHKKPQFVFFYLVSSHYGYSFPPEFEILKESPSIWKFLHPSSQIQNHLNRYTNSLLFLEDEVMKLARSMDMNRNIVVVTGDHGESMGEDGVFTHGSRMSEIQMRVPFIMVGKGVEPRKVSTATTHADVLPTMLHVLAGKKVPILNCQGRDLIADPAPSDRVAVAPANGSKWDGMMIVSGDKRFLFKPSAIGGLEQEMEFAGMADEFGHYELTNKKNLYSSGLMR